MMKIKKYNGGSKRVQCKSSEDPLSCMGRLAQLGFNCRAVFLENNSMSNFMSGGESYVFAVLNFVRVSFQRS
jgi:hypothetical protein